MIQLDKNYCFKTPVIKDDKYTDLGKIPAHPYFPGHLCVLLDFSGFLQIFLNFRILVLIVFDCEIFLRLINVNQPNKVHLIDYIFLK